jgi:hypothetical protein
LVDVGRNKKELADLGTLKEYSREVKSMNKTLQEERCTSVAVDTHQES